MTSQTTSSNANSNFLQTAKAPEAESIAVMGRNIHGATVFFKTSEGVELSAAVMRLERFRIVFEAHRPETWLRVSEVLNELKLFSDGQLLYTGRGVIRNVLNTGAVFVCEVNLDEPGVLNPIKTPDNGSTNVLD